MVEKQLITITRVPITSYDNDDDDEHMKKNPLIKYKMKNELTVVSLVLVPLLLAL